MDAQLCWQVALEILEREMSRSPFKKWMQDTWVISYEQGVLTIGVPTHEAQEWLTERAASTVKRMLEGILNPFVEVRFVANGGEEKEAAELVEESSEAGTLREREHQPESANEFEDEQKGEEKRLVTPQVGFLPGTGWTPVYDELIQRHGALVALVAGKIWRYCQMKDQVCRAAASRLAQELMLSRMTILRALQILVEDGYVVDLTPTLRHRPHVYVFQEHPVTPESPVEKSHGTHDQAQPRKSWTSARVPQSHTGKSGKFATRPVCPREVPKDPISVTLSPLLSPQDRISVPESHTDGYFTSASVAVGSVGVPPGRFSVAESALQCDSESLKLNN